MALLQIVTDLEEISECYGTLMGALQKKGKSVGKKSFDLRGSGSIVAVHEPAPNS